MKAYRLLDEGEVMKWGDEWLTKEYKWEPVYWGGIAGKDPIRRVDDGKGKYILCDGPGGTAYWDWGWGWVKWTYIPGESNNGIWRKERDVVDKSASQSSEASPGGHWVVVDKSQKTYPMWIDACKTAKQLAKDGGDGAKYLVCRIDRSFLCVINVIETEVGK